MSSHEVRAFAAWCVAVGLLAGCTSAGGDATTVPTSDAGVEPTTSVTAVEGTAPPSIPEVPSLVEGMDRIVTLTPDAVESVRPTLEWEPVADADRYRVVVLTEAGEPYWMWSGPPTSVDVGGADFSDFGIGPIIGTDFSWSVAALDADGSLIAISGRLPVSSDGP